MEKEQNPQQLPKQLAKEEESNNVALTKLQQEIETLSEEIKNMMQAETMNEIQVNSKIKGLIKLETKFHNIKELYLESSQDQSELKPEDKPQSIEVKLALMEKESEEYEPTIEEIEEKRETMLEELNDEGWTDATQSETGTLGEDGIMVLDDDMLEQMLGKEQSDNEESEEGEEEEKIDYDELEKEFVTGLESDEDYLFGKHEDNKFCVSVCSVLKEGLVMSGGGDDKLYVYQFNHNKDGGLEQQKVEEKKEPLSETEKNETKQEHSEQQQNQDLTKQEEPKAQEKPKTLMIKPHKIIPHHETIDLLDLSFDKENVFSLTEKELICTNLKTLEHTKLEIDPPTILTCHSQGGVFATANAFNVEIFNIKGFKFYDSYCMDEEVSLLKWTLNGKQLVAACDNKLRIITPKTQEVTKVTGTTFHDGEITTISLLENIVFTGCIDGCVFASNISKGQVLGGIPKLEATINTLCAAENYLIVGPATNSLHWYDSNKLKQIFTNELNGSSTDIIQLSNKNQYAVSDIRGEIHLYDRRNPMEHKFLLRAGNTVHQLFYEDSLLLAACEDGCVRGWDLRKYQY